MEYSIVNETRADINVMKDVLFYNDVVYILHVRCVKEIVNPSYV
jgi:hypothetical protein